MHGLLRCLIYVAAIGASGFLLGRLLALKRIDFDAFPFREWPFENGGHFYRRFKIHRWQSRLPDMSRILPGTMPPKRLTRHITSAEAERMVRETCVAESIHLWLSAASIACVWLWPGPGGALFWAAYVLLGNLPFIMIQRFTRPKLKMLWQKCLRAERNRR